MRTRPPGVIGMPPTAASAAGGELGAWSSAGGSRPLSDPDHWTPPQSATGAGSGGRGVHSPSLGVGPPPGLGVGTRTNHGVDAAAAIPPSNGAASWLYSNGPAPPGLPSAVQSPLNSVAAAMSGWSDGQSERRASWAPDGGASERRQSWGPQAVGTEPWPSPVVGSLGPGSASPTTAGSPRPFSSAEGMGGGPSPLAPLGLQPDSETWPLSLLRADEGRHDFDRS
jgi:hypothetical protein